jgi:uncharacterized protein (TIGR02246 family)
MFPRKGNIMPSIEGRIRKLEDRAAIQDLVATYFRATDDDDEGALAECFTEDSEFTAPGFDGGIGRAGVIAFLKAARSVMQQTVHTPNYVHITFVEDDVATGLVVAHIEIGISETTVFGAVRYVDEYRRESAKWRIRRREMRTVHLGSWDEAARSLVEPLNVRWPDAEPRSSDVPRST